MMANTIFQLDAAAQLAGKTSMMSLLKKRQSEAAPLVNGE